MKVIDRSTLTIFIVPRHFIFLFHQVKQNILQHHDLQLILIANPTEQVVVVIANLLTCQILAICDTKITQSLKNFTLQWLNVAVQEEEKCFEHFITDFW